MQSTTRNRTKRITLGTLLIGALAFANAAEAGDRNDRRQDPRHRAQIDRNDSVREARDRASRDRTRAAIDDARRVDRRLDRRGEAIDHQLDFLALLAAVSGEHRLAHELDRTGDRIERRYDRRGDRLLRNARGNRRSDDHRKSKRHHHKPDRREAKGLDDHRHHAKWGHTSRRHNGTRTERNDALALLLRLGIQ